LFAFVALLSRIRYLLATARFIQKHERDFVHQIVTTGSIMGSNLAQRPECRPEGLRYERPLVDLSQA
jgi:hypothetical protein